MRPGQCDRRYRSMFTRRVLAALLALLLVIPACARFMSKSKESSGSTTDERKPTECVGDARQGEPGLQDKVSPHGIPGVDIDNLPPETAIDASVAFGRRTESTDSRRKATERIHTVASGLTGEDKWVLKTWFKRDFSVTKAARVGAICLRYRLSKSEIIGLVGKPTRERQLRGLSISYDFAPSQTLILRFDVDGTIVRAAVSGAQVNADGSLRKTFGVH